MGVTSGAALRAVGCHPARESILKWILALQRCDDRRQLAISIKPVAILCDLPVRRASIVPEVRRELVTVERELRSLSRTDNNASSTPERVSKLHHAAWAHTGQIHNHKSCAVKRLKDLDVHECRLGFPETHFTRREPPLFNHYIDDIAEESLHGAEIIMWRCEQPNVERRARAQIVKQICRLARELVRIRAGRQSQIGQTRGCTPATVAQAKELTGAS